jgi:hypothetical protein
MVMLIGIGHRAFVGKDEIANYLVAEYGFYRRAFADSLKDAVGVIFGLTSKQMYTFVGKSTVDPFWNETPRAILQRFGTECARNHYDDQIWVKSLFKFIHDNALDNTHDRWVVPDVRFSNEVQAIKDHNGIVVEIVRTGHMGENIGIAGHASEISLDSYDGWDYVLENDGTLEDLYSKVDEMMEKFGVPKADYIQQEVSCAE